MDPSSCKAGLIRRFYLRTQLTVVSDFHHIDLIAHFDRERIPERVSKS